MSNQVHRIIRILALLSTGERITATEIQVRLHGEGDLRDVSLRQIQRDLKEIETSNVPLRCERDGRELRWSIPSEYRNLVPISISHHEVLAIHLLKGALQNFKGTRIEADVNRLRDKLERMAPGTVFLREDVVSEVSPGRYMNAVSDETLEQIITAIIDPRWDLVTYRAIGANGTKTYTVSFCRMVNHAGRLYVIAWHPVYQQYITLAADRIEHVETNEEYDRPLHEFNEKVYRGGRFGVYDGKPASVVIRVAPDAAPYFASRHWHPSESFTHHRDGSLTLRMRVPISPELVSWVMGWAGSLQVKGPEILIDACRQRARQINRW